MFERPASVEELAAALERAAHAHQHVRVAGAGHSFSALVPTDGMLISLERMNRVLKLDRDSGLVRVQAGIGLHKLNAALSAHSIALENVGDVDSQSLAGAISTGTHGTGIGLRNLSAPVHEIELMRADGSVLSLNEHSDADAWRAARVSLGALGVITALTVQTVPDFQLRAVDGPMLLDQALEQLDQLVDGHDHFELYWFPYSRRALLRRNDRTTDPARERSALHRYLQEILLVNHGLHAFCLLGRRIPALIPLLNRTATRLGDTSRRVDISSHIFVTRRLVRFTEMEYAIPREHAVAAVRAIRELIQTRRLRVSFPIEVRFAASDDALLSPAHGRETCYIAVHMFDRMQFEPYFRAVEEIMVGFGGRPHWGKRHSQTAETLRPRYPEWNRFQAVRARLDPEGRFTNAELERVLGPVGAG